jgi:hypothetical protein
MNTEASTSAKSPAGDIVAMLGHNSRIAMDWWPVGKLWQAKKDPRRYSRKELAKTESIIRRFGVRLPLPISSDGCVIAHFVIVAAARKIGIDQVPVIYVDDLGEAERKALSLALNRLYEFGEFDQQLLGELIVELEVEIPELSMEAIGFEQAEVDLAIQSSRVSAPDDERPPRIQGAPVSRLGDIWLLEEHRIAFGDATDPSSYAALLNGHLARMVFTDPPYGCPVKGFVTSRSHREFVEASGEKGPAELKDWFGTVCSAVKAHVERGALIQLCIDWRSQYLLQEAAQPFFGPLLNLAVWVKDRAGMGSFLRSQHELVLIYRAGGGLHRNNVQLGRHGRHRTNVWKYPCAASFAKGPEGDLLEDHPTPKPKEMIADAILDCTSRGDIVLDPFLGSGSTLIAAEMTGRTCCGMDLDPLYVDLAIRRWQAWTGRSAVHAVSGRSFDDVEAATKDARTGEARHG